MEDKVKAVLMVVAIVFIFAVLIWHAWPDLLVYAAVISTDLGNLFTPGK